MKRHLLLTVSEDVSALYGVRFVTSFIQNKDMMEATVLFVAQGGEGPGQSTCSLMPTPESALSESQCAKGNAALKTACQLLEDRGFKKDHIQARLVNKRFGTVKDIAREARAGMYDAVVFGRRGYYLFEKTLTTSVSREMMEHRIDFPIWVCRMPEEDRRNVLVCVDDSEPSLRIADHVGFMLEREEQHSITLLHVSTGKKGDPDVILNTARERLKINGIPDQRIRLMVVPGYRTVNTILEETERGRYAAVAVGRGGSEAQGFLGKLLMGSVSMKLMETLEKSVLWVSK
jgi:nucleotide-binding universal stress UspA family protein